MLALAFLQVCAAQRGHQRLWTAFPTRLRHDHHGRDDVGDLIAVTAAEIRRLLTAFTHPQHPGEHYQHWSRWRRHHQAQARQSHYQRRLTNQPLPMRS